MICSPRSAGAPAPGSRTRRLLSEEIVLLADDRDVGDPGTVRHTSSTSFAETFSPPTLSASLSRSLK